MEHKIENVPIEKIYRSDKSKDGKPFISSKGNKFTKVDIYINHREIDDPDFDGKMSYFEYYNATDAWDIGTLITGTVVKNGQYFNFQLPASAKKRLEESISDHEERLRKLEEVVFPAPVREVEYKKTKAEAPPFEGEDDIEIDDPLPF